MVYLVFVLPAIPSLIATVWFLKLQELLAAYEAEGTATGTTRLLLTAAVAAGKVTIDAGYEIPEICA